VAAIMFVSFSSHANAGLLDQIGNWFSKVFDDLYPMSLWPEEGSADYRSQRSRLKRAYPPGGAKTKPAKEDAQTDPKPDSEEDRAAREKEQSSVLATLKDRISISSANVARSMQSSLHRRRQATLRLHDRRWMLLQSTDREVGSFEGDVGVDGEYVPSSVFGSPLKREAVHQGEHALVDYQFSPSLNVGASLSYFNDRTALENRGKVDLDSWQAAVYALLNDGGPSWLAGDLSIGRASLKSNRNMLLTLTQNAQLSSQNFKGSSHALSIGARVLGGYDFDFGAIKSGPFAGLNYSRSRIDKFQEEFSGAPIRDLGLTMEFGEQNSESLEASLGWRMRGEMYMPGGLVLVPYAKVELVNELADGRPDELDLKNDFGRLHTVNLGSSDKSFGRAQVGGRLAITPQIGVYLELNSRFEHAEGRQNTYSTGLNWRF